MKPQTLAELLSKWQSEDCVVTFNDARHQGLGSPSAISAASCSKSGFRSKPFLSSFPLYASVKSPPLKIQTFPGTFRHAASLSIESKWNARAFASVRATQGRS